MHRKQNKKELITPCRPRDKVAGFRCSYRTSMSSYDDYERYLAVYEGDLFVFLDDELAAGESRPAVAVRCPAGN